MTYTQLKLNNELMAKLQRTQFSGYEWRIIWAVFRFTYGWHKSEDTITIGQFQLATEIPRQKVCESLVKLVTKKVLVKTKKGNLSVYKFNTDFTQWVVTKSLLVTKKGTKVVTKSVPTKGKKENKEEIFSEDYLIKALEGANGGRIYQGGEVIEVKGVNND